MGVFDNCALVEIISSKSFRYGFASVVAALDEDETAEFQTLLPFIKPLKAPTQSETTTLKLI